MQGRSALLAANIEEASVSKGKSQDLYRWRKSSLDDALVKDCQPAVETLQ